MNFILGTPNKYLYILIFLWMAFGNHFMDMNNEEKHVFFNILGKTQLVSIYFLLIISSVHITNNLNLINLSYLYFIITINIVIALLVFYLKLDKFIDKILKKYVTNKFIHSLLVIICFGTMFIHEFFPQLSFIKNHTTIILSVFCPLQFFYIKYIK